MSCLVHRSRTLLIGKRTNDIDALWTKRQSEVSDEEATAFYRFVGGAIDTPAFRLHFSADAPLTIRALLFAPADNPERGFAARGLEGDQSGLSLYSRRVLIQQNARGLLPGFMRWVRGGAPLRASIPFRPNPIHSAAFHVKTRLNLSPLVCFIIPPQPV